MSGNFLKFKKRLQAIRIVRSVLAGLATGITLGGVALLLSKLAIIDYEPIVALYIGIGVALITGGLFFLLSGRGDKAFAEELDSEFGLKARVQTMIAYAGEEGDMVALQRQDTDSALGKIPVRSYKFKGLWIYVSAVALSLAVLIGGLLSPDMRDYVPPEEIVPFELSDLQEAGLTELIKYVQNSEMEEEFRTPIADELGSLLERLRGIDTQPDMRVALAEAMAVILDITYKSSTETEILNTLWDTEDINIRYLAQVLDTSSWSAPDWGDFAEKLTEYLAILMGDKNEGEDALHGVSALSWALDSMTRKLEIALESSGVSADDELYAALDGLIYGESDSFAALLKALDKADDKAARDALAVCLDAHSQEIYGVISQMKKNTLVGEYTMTRLASLFLVPLPEFERPEFVKNGETVDGGKSDAGEEDKDNTGNNDGGIGEGATYGSKDLVLDPLTGNYVEYGELIDKYYAVMFEKLEGNSYTEEQREIIKKYFALLYSGIEKEEGK